MWAEARRLGLVSCDNGIISWLIGETLSMVEDMDIALGSLGYLHSEKLTDFLSGQLVIDR